MPRWKAGAAIPGKHACLRPCTFHPKNSHSCPEQGRRSAARAPYSCQRPTLALAARRRVARPLPEKRPLRGTHHPCGGLSQEYTGTRGRASAWIGRGSATPRVLASVREAQTTRDAVWASRNGRWRQRRLHRGAAGASRAIPVLTPWTARADPRVTAQSALRPMPNAAIPLPKRVHLFHTMVRNR